MHIVQYKLISKSKNIQINSNGNPPTSQSTIIAPIAFAVFFILPLFWNVKIPLIIMSL